MDISIAQLSKYLGVSLTTIERWIRQGKFPVAQKGSTYTFQARDLKKWAAKNNFTLNLEPPRDPAPQNEAEVELSAAMDAGGVYHDIEGTDVPSVLEACIDRIEAVPADFKGDLLEQVLKREQALSTGVGNGMAVPHPRTPLGYLAEPLVATCFLNVPVDYKALDQKPVSILFFILCPELKFHLHLLSSLSFCLRDRPFCEFLRTCPDKSGLIEQVHSLKLSEGI